MYINYDIVTFFLLSLSTCLLALQLELNVAQFDCRGE